MFPLCDARGRVLGFGARAVGERCHVRVAARVGV
jgi:hypothetical protein